MIWAARGIAVLTLLVGVACVGDGDDDGERDAELALWAAAMCSAAEALEVDIGGGLVAAQTVAGPNSGRAGVAAYAGAVREVEGRGREILSQVRAIELPPSDTSEFHNAQLVTIESLVDSFGLFAEEMESFLETDDVEALSKAYPGLLEREEERVALLAPALQRIPADAADALDGVVACGGLHTD